MTHSPHITSNPKIERLPKERFVASFCCDEGNCPECLRAYREGLAFMRQERAARMRQERAARKLCQSSPDGLKTAAQADPLSIGHRQRVPRRPTLASVIKQARKAGIDPARVEIKSDGGYVVDTNKSEHQQGNEVDEWMAKHAYAPERH